MTTTSETYTEAAFSAWLMTAQPGDRALYFSGYLACAAQALSSVRRMREVVQEAAAVNPRPLAKDTSTTAHEERTLFFSPSAPRLVELVAERAERGFHYYAIARRHHSPRFRSTR